MQRNPAIEPEEVRYLSGLRSDVPEGSFLPPRIPSWVRSKILEFRAAIANGAAPRIKFTDAELGAHGVRHFEGRKISPTAVSHDNLPATDTERLGILNRIASMLK